MGRSSGKKKGKKNPAASENHKDGSMIWVDPNRVRFQHSKIRPLFSGCGRSIYDTLESIRNREITPSDLPPIQVIVGPGTEDEGPWYFSLNNRRLWVLKRCREEGLLENNQIQVRVRAPKSSAEEARYSLQNCALEAKVIREPGKQPQQQSTQHPSAKEMNDEGKCKEEPVADRGKEDPTGPADGSSDEDDDSDDEDSEDGGCASKNPFSALM
jgi:hypothetical protein